MPSAIVGSRTLLVPNQGGTSVAALVILYQRKDSTLWPGVPDPVTPPEATPIITSESFTMSVSLYRATIDNQLIEDLSGQLFDGAITMNLDRDIKLSGTLRVRDPSNITPYTDYLAPFMRLVFDDGRDDVYLQLGLYATKLAPGTFSINDSVATFDIDDLTSVLAQSAYTNTINSAAAANYVTEIRNSLSAIGITRTNIPDTTSTTPVAQSWPPGTTRLTKNNDMLDQLGWYHLGMDLDGRISTPGAPQALASMEPWRTLTDSDIIGTIDVQPTGQEIANQIIVINDDGAAAPLTSTAINSDPSSPTSTAVIGRTIMRTVSVSGSTTQAALDALAARLLAEGRSYYRVAKFTLLHDPTALALHQTVRLALTGSQAELSGLWWIRKADLGLTPGKPLTLECNQITDDTNAAVI